MKKILPLFMLVALAISALPLQAQQAKGIKLDRSIFEENVEPGEVIADSFFATNISESEQAFYLVKRNISGVRSDGVPMFAEPGEATPYDLSEWILVSDEQIILAPNERVEIPFTITVPDDASPGGHYGVIFLSAQAPENSDLGSAIGYDVGARIDLRVAGDVVEKASIREFVTDKDIYSDEPVVFTVRIENEGNVVSRPRGPIDIVNAFGDTVGTVVVNNDAGGVFPLAERSFEVTWQNDRFAFGPHRATMSLVFGQNERQTISAVASFWVLPMNILVPLVAGSALFIIILVVGVRLYVRRRIAAVRMSSQAAAAPQGVIHEMLDPSMKAPFSKVALITTLLLVFALMFLMVFFFLFA